MDTRTARHQQTRPLPPRPSAAARYAGRDLDQADYEADGAAAAWDANDACRDCGEHISDPHAPGCPAAPESRYSDAALDAMAARGPGMAAAAAALRTIADVEDRALAMDDAHALIALHGARYVAAVEQIVAAYHGGQDLGELAARRDIALEGAGKQAERIAKAATGHVL